MAKQVEEIVKLRLANGRIIERPRKVARFFIRGGAEEILPIAKPKEVLTKTTAKTPPPVILKEPEVIKPPETEYPGEPTQVNEPVQEEIKVGRNCYPYRFFKVKSEVQGSTEVKTDEKKEIKEPVRKIPAKKKSTKKAKK